MRREQTLITDIVENPATHIYICGLKGMEQGVDAAFNDICRGAGITWEDLRASMRQAGRYHIETY